MKPLMLAAAIVIGLSAAAHARELSFLCHLDGISDSGFNITVDLEHSALTVHERIRTLHSDARITPDYIEYNEGMYQMRIDRKSGGWLASSYTGSTARGSCQQTDDQQRLERNICCALKINPALCPAGGC